MKIRWGYISLFLILAIGISAPIHLGYFDNTYQELTNNWIVNDWVYLIAGIGPFIAGLLILLLDKSVSKRITIWGDEKAKNTLIALLPVFMFPVFVLENSNDINIHFLFRG